MAKGNFKIFRI